MTFNQEKELNIILKIIDKEEDTLKAWWITLTGLASAIVVGTFVSYFSGRITVNNQDSVLIILLLFLPILIIFLFELFLRRIELNTKTKRIISCYLDPKKNKSLLNIDYVLLLIDLDINKLEFLEKQLRPIQKVYVKYRIVSGIFLSLYIDFFVLFSWIFYSDIVLISEAFLFFVFVSIITLISIIVWMFLAHRIIKRVIRNWGEDKKDNTANETS